MPGAALAVRAMDGAGMESNATGPMLVHEYTTVRAWPNAGPRCACRMVPGLDTAISAPPEQRCQVGTTTPPLHAHSCRVDLCFCAHDTARHCRAVNGALWSGAAGVGELQAARWQPRACLPHRPRTAHCRTGTAPSQGAFIVWAAALLATVIAGGITWLRHPSGNPILPDIVQELVPQQKDICVPFAPAEWGWCVDTVDHVDNMISVLAGATFLLTATRRAPWLILRRVWIVHAAVLLLRVFTVLCTALPDSRPKCHKATPGVVPLKDITWAAVSTIALQNRLDAITCGDMVYSGHTCISVCLGMAWHTYYKVKSGPCAINYVKLAVWAWVGTILTLIVTARLHYTLDVFLAAVLTVVTWGAYHRVADDVLLGHRFYSVWLVDSRVLYPFVAWLEAPHLREVERNMGAHSHAPPPPATDDTSDEGGDGGDAKPSLTPVESVEDVVDTVAGMLRKLQLAAEEALTNVSQEGLRARTVDALAGMPSLLAGDAAGVGRIARDSLEGLLSGPPSDTSSRARSAGRRVRVAGMLTREEVAVDDHDVVDASDDESHGSAAPTTPPPRRMPRSKPPKPRARSRRGR